MTGAIERELATAMGLCSSRGDEERVAEAQEELARLRNAADAIGMLVARLENLQRNGDTWLTVASVLAMIGDCEMLASRNAGPGENDGRRD